MTKNDLERKNLKPQAIELIMHRASNLHKMFQTPMEDAITIMFNTLDRPTYSKAYPSVVK